MRLASVDLGHAAGQRYCQSESKPSFAIIIYLAGLQDIPDSLYEAAELDGAGFIKKTFYVTILS